MLDDALVEVAEGEEADLLAVLGDGVVDKVDDLLGAHPAVGVEDEAVDALLRDGDADGPLLVAVADFKRMIGVDETNTALGALRRAGRTEVRDGVEYVTFPMWEPVAVSEPTTHGLIERYRQVPSCLRNETAEHYALRAPRTGLRLDEAAQATAERLKEALVHLPDEEFKALLEAREQARDQQIEADAQAGKLDGLAQDALRSYREGNVAKLP